MIHSYFKDEEPAKLEPVPAEVNLPDDFPDEGKWSSYPMNQAQSAFSQYRDFVSCPSITSNI